MKNSTYRNFFIVPYVLWIVMFVVLPIILVVYNSFLDINGNLTLANYERFFSETYLKMAFNSFLYATIITVGALAVAFPTALLITKTKHKRLWLMLIILPTWINLLLKTYAFIGIFGAEGSVNKFLEFVGIGATQILFTPFSFIVVSIYIFIPFMVIPIFNSLDEIDPSYYDAANDLGASKWTTFRKVTWPLAVDGVKSGCMVVFIPALSLFMITRLIAGNKVITLGTAIEQHFLVTQDWGMGSTIAVFLMLAMVGLMFLFRSKVKGGKM